MKLFYSHDPIGNFGDDLNPWLWPKLIPELLDNNDDVLLVGIGTILNSASGRSIPVEPLKVVFGAGAGYGAPPKIDDKWKIYCVRGPLTAKKLGISTELAITDPGLLLSKFFYTQDTSRLEPAFMPHHGTRIRTEAHNIDLNDLCMNAGIRYIDPCDDVDKVLSEIQKTTFLITEAMHGAIAADALRVPWLPVNIYDHILPFKWQDWCLSMELEYEPSTISLLSEKEPIVKLSRFLSRCTKSPQLMLSNKIIFNRRISEFQHRLGLLKNDFEKRHNSLNNAETNINLIKNQDAILSIRSNKQYQMAYRKWWHNYELVSRYISISLPPSSRCILIDDGTYGSSFSDIRKIIPFLNKNGIYWGPPENSKKAIAELKKECANGATHIIFSQPGMWMLEHFFEFAEYLQQNYKCIINNDFIIVFDLRAAT